MKLLLTIAILMTTVGCQKSESSQSEFTIVNARNGVSSFLIERRSGCIWMVGIRPDQEDPKNITKNKDGELEITREDYDAYVESRSQSFDSAKENSSFEIFDVKSANNKSCNDRFGLVVQKGASNSK